jgi:hypothetical protein
VYNFLKVTKIDSELSQIDQVIDSKLQQKKAEIESLDSYNKFSRVVKNNFNSEKSIEFLKTFLIKKTEDKDLKDIIELYDNPLLIKMSGYESSFNDPKNKEAQLAFFKNLKTNPPKQERVNLLIKLNETLNSTVRTKDLLEKIIMAFSKGYNLTLPKEKQLGTNELNTKIKSELPANISQQITNQSIAVGLYVYKSVNDDELKKYIKIWKTDIGKRYIDLTFKAYEAVFEKMSIDLINNLNNTF